MPTEVDVVTTLDREIRKSQKSLKKSSQYFEGEQPLKYMAPALEAEIGDRVTQLVINWPRMVTEAYENRQDIQGFRYTDSAGESRDQDLWDLYTANDGMAQTQLLNTELLISGRHYVITGAGESKDDAPIFTIEDASQMIAVHNPRTHDAEVLLKRWVDEDNAQRASLYLPNSTVQFVKRRTDGWVEDDRSDHNAGRPMAVEFLNRRRLLRQSGVSEFRDVIPVADAANKMATDMMVSGEFHAMPRRWALGMGDDEFKDEDGNKVSAWSIIAGRIWNTEAGPKEVELGQFDEADLAVFHNTIKMLAQIAGHLMFLPDAYMSFTTDNPPSADAMRASETRFVKRCERKNANTGSGMNRVLQRLLWIQTGQWDPKARSIETLWRDPATPTIAQVADAVVKKVQAKIIPVEFAREELGYTLEQRLRMKDMDAAAVALDPLAALADQFRTQPAPAPGNGNAAA